MAELPLNPNVPLFRWGPIPGHWLYVSRWNEMCHKDFPKHYREAAWSRALVLCRDGRMIVIMEDKAMRSKARKMFLELVLPAQRYQEARNAYEKAAKKLRAVEQQIESSKIDSLSSEQLAESWDDLHKAYGEFWLPTQAPEIGNYGAEVLLKEELLPYISDPLELAQALEVLTTVEELSFYQQEEVELAETSDVTEHQNKYFWLKNSYAGSQTLPIKFFEERKQSPNPNVRAEFAEKFKKVREKKQNLQ